MHRTCEDYNLVGAAATRSVSGFAPLPRPADALRIAGACRVGPLPAGVHRMRVLTSIIRAIWPSK